MLRLTLDIPDGLGDDTADGSGDVDGGSQSSRAGEDDPRQRGESEALPFVRWVACWAESDEQAE
jgi:hypothetical protein